MHVPYRKSFCPWNWPVGKNSYVCSVDISNTNCTSWGNSNDVQSDHFVSSKIGICHGTFEIVLQEVLWSILRSHQTLWSLPLPNVTWHSGTWPYTMTPSIDQTLLTPICELITELNLLPILNLLPNLEVSIEHCNGWNKLNKWTKTNYFPQLYVYRVAIKLWIKGYTHSWGCGIMTLPWTIN